ncbi:hypothetical protein SAMN04488003_101193 [Loktanella fryxellensis]|uniref:TVP38/TMEM64 family membrane protein n=2 Tax=Loktanella fryxellensis TaxID=245187 RepID=A0A1H7YL39_9RHOB|nr:hypothetical protein SAMN04488003_101193 [Loktanella fryxellensis]
MPRSRIRVWAMLALRLLILAALVAGGLALVGWMQGHVADLEAAAQRRTLTSLVIVAMVAYALIIAIPFIPGIEIAVALMVMAGPVVAPFVWIATVLGLMLAYLAGRWIALGWLAGLLTDLRLHRAAGLVCGIAQEAPEARLAALARRLPRGLAPLATRYRYGLIALLLNVPGNIALGGGGGILLGAGVSRLFTPGRTLLTIALATAPVPLAVWLWGAGLLT